jgi:hypothetical protein
MTLQRITGSVIPFSNPSETTIAIAEQKRPLELQPLSLVIKFALGYSYHLS